ncbi:MAG: UpxY family transcription antiterminator [Weeksellaceae bacterium]|jgi:transcription antitermination factor NusG|nr:UpxY family transcription antiterminator [Weeksellaceae bacterium]
MSKTLSPALHSLSQNNLSDETKDWFVVRTNSRCEKKVNQFLTDLGYTSFLPLHTVLRIWSDRKKKVQLPLIPSMVFVQNPLVKKEALYSVPGFHSILKDNGKIGRVSAKEIEHLRILSSEKINFDKAELPKFAKGEEIEIIRGPFAGHYAKAIEDLNSFRVLIEIPSLGLGYALNLAKNHVRKVK